MKKTSISTAKSSDDTTLESLSKLIGKRTRSIVLINNIDPSPNSSKDLSSRLEVGSKRFKSDGEKGIYNEGGITKLNTAFTSKEKYSALNSSQYFLSHTLSTNSEFMKDEESKLNDIDEDDSESLTASDFEILNSENFFDRINDAF